jgi:hypothetical protein
MKIGNVNVLMIATVCAIGIAASGCSSGGSGSGPGAGGNGTVKITGQMDNATVTMAAADTRFSRLLAYLSPEEKAFAAGTTVNNIVAISSDGTVAQATTSGSDFSLNLDKGKPYIIGLLNGTSIVGLYKADSTTGMHSFPISANSTDINLGTVSLNGSDALGSITSSTLLQDLGLSQSIATAYGIMDIAMTRLSNVDVDGNGVIDHQENKSYSIGLDYEFDGNNSFSAIQGAWSDHTAITYKGYEYYFWANPDMPSANWSGAALHTPATVNGLNDQAPCWNVSDSSGRNLNFFCGGSATTPATPPAGTYTVTVDSTVLTFKNVNSQTIDSNLYNIYMPQIRLTMANGKITNIEWQWWKKLNDGSWVQPSDAELSTVLNNAGYEIGDSSWSVGNRVRGNINLTTSGSTAPASQSFTPGVFRVIYADQAGYNYGFEWQ